jgi:methylated-DNA-[protein]-cysteine S-methyltransferase
MLEGFFARISRNLAFALKASILFDSLMSIFVSNFNKQVWAALELIPRGKVTTYKEIAKFVGRLGAARAVGSACHKNFRAPAVPCHRVVKSDGKLGGYARGVKIKNKLLEAEGVEVSEGRVKEFKGKLYKFKERK